MKKESEIILSIVIPVYRSDKSLRDLCSGIVDILEKNNISFEIILVNDASPDSSWQIMKKLREKDIRIKIIQLSKNFGQHAAILCGFKYAKGKFIVTMDDDLQHPPKEIVKLYKAISEDDETDIYIGKYKEKKHNLIRNIGSKILNYFSSVIFSKPKELTLTSFRIIRKDIVSSILLFKNSNPRIGQTIMLTTNRIKNISVEHEKRIYGKSTYSTSRLIKDFLDSILFYSSIPLKLVSYIGLFCFFLSIILGIYYFLSYIFNDVVIMGWTSIILLLFFFFGLLFLSIGIIGEYLIRILQESKKLPQYIIREKQID